MQGQNQVQEKLCNCTTRGKVKEQVILKVSGPGWAAVAPLLVSQGWCVFCFGQILKYLRTTFWIGTWKKN